jgi:hypothetical protein
MPATTATSQATLAVAAQAYFNALADGNLAQVPWDQAVTMRTPILDAPLEGRDAVEAFFRPLAGQLGAIHILDTYSNAAGDTIVAEARVGPLHVMDKFLIRNGHIIEQQNFYDPRPLLDAPAPGGLTTQERALLVEILEAGRDQFRAVIHSAPNADWTRKPDAASWSAADCAEHLVLTEEALLGLVRNQILTSTADPSLSAELQGKDALVVKAMHNRSVKAKTFDFLEPRGRWTTQASVLDAFLARRGATLDYVRTTRDPLHHHAAPLEGLGALDGYQWLLLIAAHTQRHLDQLNAALNAIVPRAADSRLSAE